MELNVSPIHQSPPAIPAGDRPRRRKRPRQEGAIPTVVQAPKPDLAAITMALRSFIAPSMAASKLWAGVIKELAKDNPNVKEVLTDFDLAVEQISRITPEQMQAVRLQLEQLNGGASNAKKAKVSAAAAGAGAGSPAGSLFAQME